jgi:hypothetical protein
MTPNGLGGSTRAPGITLSVPTNMVSGTGFAYPQGASVYAPASPPASPVFPGGRVSQEDMDEASSALAGWAGLNECRALGAFIPVEVGVKGYPANVTNTGVPPAHLQLALRMANWDDAAVGRAFDLLRQGGKVWLLVEKP